NSRLMDRRTFMELGAMAIAGTAIPARAGRYSLGGSPMQTPEHLGRAVLPKIQVDPKRVIRVVTGLRPYRPSGFALRAERRGAKTIIHNYGHGGCGFTLSWGTANLAVNHALHTGSRNAAVLGCGSVGLATARLLQDHGFRVTIYAKDLPPNTTSNIAGGLWMPVTLVDRDKQTPAFADQLSQASRFSHRYFQTLAGPHYGVRWVEMYYVGDSPAALPWAVSMTPELCSITTMAPGTHPFKAQYVSLVYVMLFEPSIYLPAVMSDFCVRGGKIAVRSFPNLASILRLPEPVIVNCTGLGAKALFNDDELIPVKGQLSVLLPQPEVDYAVVSSSSDAYMFPRTDGIILGGSHERGEWSLDPDPAVADRILRENQEIFSPMR
ncbi:MAG TPA: FAD-dependent oxidoreductase, partial [Blastocatellia bacterium]|nr:FAD-dependent oxidoreductase [Blastocatellia bacterium]